MNFAADVLSFEVRAIEGILHEGEARVIFRGAIGAFIDGNSTFAALLGKKADGGISKPCQLDISTEAGIDRRSLPAGDHSAFLTNKDSAFPMLSSGKAIGGSAISHLRLATAKDGSTQGEMKESICGGIGIINGEKQGMIGS